MDKREIITSRYVLFVGSAVFRLLQTENPLNDACFEISCTLITMKKNSLKILGVRQPPQKITTPIPHFPRLSFSFGLLKVSELVPEVGLATKG